MDNTHRAHTAPEWRVFGACACVFNVLMAGIYVWVQSGLDTYFDAPLVALITLNSLIIYVFGIYVVRDLTAMLSVLPDVAQPASMPLQDRVNALFSHPFGPYFALGYAAFAGTGGFLIGPWDEGSSLRSILALFIFSGNLIVGYAVFAIIQYWRLILRNLEQINFRVLNLSRPPLPEIMRFNSRIVMVTAFVASAAVLGLGLSDYAANPPIVLFSIFAFAMTAATYAVPVVPISNRLRRLKTEALDHIEAKIQIHVDSLTDSAVNTDDLPDLSALKDARDLVGKVQTLPPGGQVSVSAAAMATALPFIPSAVEYLTKLFE